MSALLVFTVPGRPVSWQRPHFTRGRHTTDAKQRQAKRAIAAAASAHIPAHWPRDVAYSVRIDAYYPTRVYGDIDRIAGLPLDALEGIAYESDRQVSELRVERHVDRERPRVDVRVVAIDPALETDAIMHGEVAR